MKDLLKPYRYIRNKLYQLQAAVAYARHGWNSRDYDSISCIRDMIFSFQRLADHIKEHDVHEGSDKTYNDIVDFVYNLKLISEQIDLETVSPLKELKKEHEEKYGELQMNTKPIPGRNVSECIFTWSKAVTEEQTDSARTSSLYMYEVEEKMKQEALSKVGDYIKHELLRWWC